MRFGSRMGLIAGLAVAASAMFAAGPGLAQGGSAGVDPLTGLNPFSDRRRGKGQNNRRGKGLRAKPKKRSNRLTISKRVRRKHRRAA